MINKLLSYSGKYKYRGYLSVLFIFFSVISEIIVFYLIFLLINSIINYELSLRLIIIYGSSIVVLYGFKAIFFSLGLDSSHVFAYNTLFNLREKFSNKLKKISLGTIIEKGSGAYRQNLVDDIESIEILLAHGLPEGLPYLVSFISVYAVVFFIDFRLGLLSLITLPIGIIAMALMVKGSVEKNDQYQKSLVDLNKSIVEYVEGMEVIKVFNKSEKTNKKIINTIENYKNFTTDWYKGNWTYMAIFQSVVPTTIAFVLPVGLYMVSSGKLELSVLLFSVILLLSISTPLLKLMTYFPVLYHIINKIEKLEAEFDQAEIIVSDKYQNIKKNSIEFKKVVFSYKDTIVIDNMNFNINEREKIGIVGESGSGKSTIGKLIMHYWDINSGEILIGGIDIREISLSTLMNKISYVSQDNFLFNITIKENLLLAKEDATEEEIIKACKNAYCHDFIIKLENAYDTKVGDSGNKLSGGERQRITIARAILKESEIIILDEATSFTDPENNALINEAIINLTKEKTLITIAHKLTTMKEMDKIMLIENGKLAAFDTHKNMLNNLHYKNLWDRYEKSLNYKFKVRGDNNV